MTFRWVHEGGTVEVPDIECRTYQDGTVARIELSWPTGKGPRPEGLPDVDWSGLLRAVLDAEQAGGAPDGT